MGPRYKKLSPKIVNSEVTESAEYLNQLGTATTINNNETFSKAESIVRKPLEASQANSFTKEIDFQNILKENRNAAANFSKEAAKEQEKKNDLINHLKKKKDPLKAYKRLPKHIKKTPPKNTTPNEAFDGTRKKLSTKGTRNTKKTPVFFGNNGKTPNTSKDSSPLFLTAVSYSKLHPKK